MSFLARLAALRRIPRQRQEQIPRSEVGQEIEKELNKAFQKYEEPEKAISTLARVLSEHFKMFEPLKERQSSSLIKEMTDLYKLTSEYYNQSNSLVGSTILDRSTNMFSRRVEQSYQEVVGELEEQIRRYFLREPPPLKEPNLDDSKYDFAKKRRAEVKTTMVRLADIAEYEKPNIQARRRKEQEPTDREQE